MENIVIKKIILFCGFIIFNLVVISIALSQDQISDKSELEKKLEQTAKELTQAAEKLTKEKLGKIKDSLSEGGWNIDTKEWKIITVNEAVQEKIAKIQTSIKNLFIATALNIEKEKDFEIHIDDTGLGISQKEEKKREKIIKASEKTSTTLNSRAIAIKVLYNVNEDLIAAAKREEDPNKRRNMYITQAIFVYELSSMIIDMIDNISEEGIGDIRNIYKDQMEEIAEMETEAKKMIEENNNDLQAKNWLGALDVLSERWQEFLSLVDKQGNWIENLKQKKQDFEKIVKKAAYQIKMLEITDTLEEFREEMDAIMSVIAIENIELLTLGPNEINLLFYPKLVSTDFKDKSIKLKTQ